MSTIYSTMSTYVDHMSTICHFVQLHCYSKQQCHGNQKIIILDSFFCFVENRTLKLDNIYIFPKTCNAKVHVCVLTIYQPYVNCRYTVWTTCQPHVNHMSTICQPYVNHIYHFTCTISSNQNSNTYNWNQKNNKCINILNYFFLILAIENRKLITLTFLPKRYIM